MSQFSRVLPFDRSGERDNPVLSNLCSKRPFNNCPKTAAAPFRLSIGMLIVLIRRMIGTLHIDYSHSIAVIQKQVEAVRMLRIRTTQWAVLCGTLLWVPWFAVVSQAFLGVDIYRSVDAAWLISNVLFGLAGVPAAIWASRKYADRIQRSPFFQRLMNDLAGRNLTAARGFLARLSEFEKE